MTDLSFVPVADVEVVRDDVRDFAVLLHDRGRVERAAAFLLVRHEDWSDHELYYVLGQADLEELVRAATEGGLDVGQLTREQLFQYLDVHEDTRAQEVPAGVEPGGRAVVLDNVGRVEGVWADVGPRAAVEIGGPDDVAPAAMPPSFGVPAPAPEPPGAPAPPPAAAPAPSADIADDRRGEEEPVVDPFWRRTPHMGLSGQEPLPPGASFTASVYLDTRAAEPGEEVEGVVLDLPDDLEVVEIDVMLVPSKHFAIQGDSIKTLSMHRDDERSPDLPFEVAVVDDPPLDIQASLTAYLTYRHRPCGMVHRQVEIRGAAPQEPARPAARPEPLPQLAIDARAEPADVTIQVVEGEERDGRHYEVTVRTTLIESFAMTKPEEWVFEQGTDTFVTNLMAEFTKRGATAFARQASLNGAGVQFWNAAPKCFRDLFWQLLDGPRAPKTIFVASAESNIPWELMRPRRTLPTGEIEQHDALGIEFAVGRWVHPEHRSPKQQDRIEDSYVVAPEYPVRQLATSSEEAKWVCDHFGGVAVRPAVHEQLEKVFGERPVGLVHFIAHGKSDPGAAQVLNLENDAVFYSTQVVGGMPNLETAFGRKAPLVFINACEVGQVTPTLVGPGGFAQAFIAVGARGVVAPLWSVRDSIAHEVAIEFYEAALKEPSRPFAHILTDIRRRSYTPGGGEDTYAAYCWYGDPLTALEASG